jgi:hypothetical protein
VPGQKINAEYGAANGGQDKLTGGGVAAETHTDHFDAPGANGLIVWAGQVAVGLVGMARMGKNTDQKHCGRVSLKLWKPLMRTH